MRTVENCDMSSKFGKMVQIFQWYLCSSSSPANEISYPSFSPLRRNSSSSSDTSSPTAHCVSAPFTVKLPLKKAPNFATVWVVKRKKK